MEQLLYILTKASLLVCLSIIIYIIVYPDKRVNDQTDIF